MAREFLLKNRDQVAQKLAIVIDACEQLREIDSGDGGRVDSVLHLFPFICDLRLRKTVNFGTQNAYVDGLGNVAIHSSAEKLLGVTSHGVRGHGDDGCVRATLLPSANGTGGIETAEDGHLDIHQDQIESLRAHDVHGYLAVEGEGHGVAHFFEHANAQFLVHSVVFYEKDREF